MGISNRVRIRSVKVLSQDWYVLKKTVFEYQRRDGTWQSQTRESYDRGDGCTILLYNLAQKTVILIRQFRFPVFSVGYDELLIEAPAGILDNVSPEERIKSETQEETGFEIMNVTKIFESFMSPGSVTEKLHFFTAEYQPQNKKTQGGGIKEEGEDIEVLELKIDEALGKIANGEIQDAKTIMLLQHAALHIF